MKDQAVTGALWSFADKLGAQVLSFLSFLVMARMLAPEDFGVISLAGVIVAVPALLLNEGFGIALIQRQEIDDDHINAAFWANLLLAVCIIALLQASAGTLGELTGKPMVGTLVSWLSFTCLGTALNSIAISLHIRQLRFSRFPQSSFISIISGAAVAIAMATAGFGVWALVAFQLVAAFTPSVVLWWGVNWQPRLSISWRALDDLMHFGLTTTLGNLFRFAAERVDILVIGYFLDNTALGYYYLMARLITMLETAILDPIDGVMFAVLSRMQNDGPKLRTYYLETVWASTALWLPAAFGLGAIASNLLPIAFGEHWTSAVPMLIGASLVGLTGSFVRATSSLLLAMGLPKVYAHINLLRFLVAAIVMSCATQFGPNSLGLGFALVALIMFPVHVFAVRRVTEIRILTILQAYLPIVLVGSVMAAVVFWVGTFGTGFGTVLTQIAVGIVVYSGLLFLIAPEHVQTALATLKDSSLFRHVSTWPSRGKPAGSSQPVPAPASSTLYDQSKRGHRAQHGVAEWDR